MIQVTTLVSKEHWPEAEGRPSWRVQSCTIDFGADREPLTFTPDWVYASAEAAHDDMKQQALEGMRSDGYTVSEAEVVWQLRIIRMTYGMPEYLHNGWTIQLFPSRRDNGLWACPYVCQRSEEQAASAHRTVPPGLWDTKDEAEAASLAHAKAWIDAQA